MINCLNPYCSGQWSRTNFKSNNQSNNNVLILIVVDNGLVQGRFLLLCLW